MPKKSIAKKSKKKLSSKKSAPKKLKKKITKKPTKKKAKAKLKSKKKVLTQTKGYHSVTPCLTVHDASNAIIFYKTVFGAKEMLRMEQRNGKIAHAELKIGDARVMLCDEQPEMNARGPLHYGGSPMSIYLYVKNVDATVNKAMSMGATLESPLQDMFYGDRIGMVVDPYGHRWCVATHIEDVSPAKVKKRVAALFNQ